MKSREGDRPGGRSRRLYLPSIPEEGAEVRLGEAESRYLRKVLRMGPGEEVVLFDGRGWEYPAVLLDSGPGGLTLRVTGRRKGTADPSMELRLGLGLLKAAKMDLVVQKVTELGVAHVHPLATRRSIPSLDPERAEERRRRWTRIAREASRQCGRATVPEVHPVSELDAFLHLAAAGDLAFLFTPGARRSLEEIPASAYPPPPRCLVLVGPEGGLAPEEEDLARRKGLVPVGTGPRILRAETAAILATALVQFRFGDLGRHPSPSSDDDIGA